MNRKVRKFPCNGYSHNQLKPVNFFGNVILSEHLIFFFHPSCYLTLFFFFFSPYLFNWFGLSNFRDMERMKYRVWVFFSLPIPFSQRAVTVPSSGQFLNLYGSGVRLILRLFHYYTDLAIKWESVFIVKLWKSNFFDSVTYARNTFPTMLISHKINTKHGAAVSQTESMCTSLQHVRQNAGWDVSF